MNKIKSFLNAVSTIGAVAGAIVVVIKAVIKEEA